MVIPQVTPDFLSIVLTTILTVAADYFPKFAAWFDALEVAEKRRFMLGGAVIICGVLFGIQCAGWVDGSFTCTPKGLIDLAYNVILSFALAQGVHQGTKPTPAFKQKVLAKA